MARSAAGTWPGSWRSVSARCSATWRRSPRPASRSGAVRGKAGVSRLDGGYRTRLTGVGLDEAGALAFLGLAGPAQQLGLGEILEGARIKGFASLTGEGRDPARRAAER